MQLIVALTTVATEETHCYFDTTDQTVALCTQGGESTDDSIVYEARFFYRVAGRIGKHIKTIKRRTAKGMIKALKQENRVLDTDGWV